MRGILDVQNDEENEEDDEEKQSKIHFINNDGEETPLLPTDDARTIDLEEDSSSYSDARTATYEKEMFWPDSKKRAVFRWRVISLVTQNSSLRSERRHVIAEAAQVAMKAQQVAFVPKRRTRSTLL